MSSSNLDQDQEATISKEKVLHHWYGLSGAERMALFSLAHEIVVATQLIETSVEDIVACFLQINKTVATCHERESLIRGSHKSHAESLQVKVQNSDTFTAKEKEALKWLLTERDESSQNDLKEISDLSTQAISHFQFQDRTKQRLDQVHETLGLMSSLLYEMEKNTVPHLTDRHDTKAERQWIETLIEHMKLGEMRERFIRNALFQQGFKLFEDLEDDVENSLPNEDDDIELF